MNDININSYNISFKEIVYFFPGIPAPNNQTHLLLKLHHIIKYQKNTQQHCNITLLLAKPEVYFFVVKL